MKKTRYQHDCTNCKPLGRFAEYDLYHCMQGGRIPTVIARYGPESQYLSGLPHASAVRALGIARGRAAKQGLQLSIR